MPIATRCIQSTVYFGMHSITETSRYLRHRQHWLRSHTIHRHGRTSFLFDGMWSTCTLMWALLRSATTGCFSRRQLSPCTLEASSSPTNGLELPSRPTEATLTPVRHPSPRSPRRGVIPFASAVAIPIATHEIPGACSRQRHESKGVDDSYYPSYIYA